ncbi:unnamed protein product [Effrenium voratum]|uniref:DUF1275 domain-containing protein n=1 Tax=Effrenium voratum TaxID=2562239 RepID=A0AA36ILX6_9DINO|nr:unnamed protein product [Effrenium voratum]CAJ1445135.1 unnamed protein product [Effrenium voratum]
MVSTDSWRMQKHAWIAAMLAMVTAYADVVSLMRYHSFASILTGNVIMLCRAMVDPQTNGHHFSFYLALCASFAVGAFLHRLCENWWPNRGGSLAAVPFTVLMLGVETWYLVTDEDAIYDDPVLRWSVVLVSPIFGVIAAACSTGRMGTHTTMVTGHVLTMSGVLGNLPFKKLTEQDVKKVIMSGMVLAGTVCGASLGAWALTNKTLHNVLLFPVPIVLYILMWLHDHLCQPRSLIKKVQGKIREKPQELKSETDSQDSQDLEEDDAESPDDLQSQV